MNVSHFIPYMHPRSGGPPVVVDRHCRQLAARGWNCRVVTTDSLARGEDRAWLDQYRDGYAIDVHPSRGPASFAYSPELGRAVDRVVAESDLVHVHTVWTYTNWAAIRACRRRGVPLVVMPHGMLDPHSLGRKWLKKQLYGRLCEWPNLRTAAGMIYTHDDERRLAESTVVGLPPGHIVPLAADEPPASRAELAAEFFAAHPELRGRKLVVFLGRLHSKKGLDLLIPAMARVVARQPNAHLLLVGAGAPDYEATLRHWIAANDLAAQVTFAGTLSGRDKWSALAAAETLALPSYQENFALVVVEALRMGTPVMLSRRVNIWPEITSAGAGLVCELDPESVADTALKFLADETLARQAAANGERLAREKFNWGASTDALIAAYESVLNSRNDHFAAMTKSEARNPNE